jgi:hypothetical protein
MAANAPRLLLGALAAVLVLVGSAAGAANEPTLHLDPDEGAARDWVTVTGAGYPSATHGEVTLGTTVVGRVRANRTGDITMKFRVPVDAAPGVQPVTVRVGPVETSAPFEVLGDEPPAPEPPPTDPGEPGEEPVPPEPPEDDPAVSTVLFGVSTQSGWWNFSELDDFEAKAEKPVGLFMYFQGWADHAEFNPAWLDPIVERGIVPMVTWEPWDYRRGLNQRKYRLVTIIDGSHDAYIRRWATDAARWGKPLMLRFAHEMNGSWYPWSEQTNGNQPGEYRQAWRHVHGLFQEAGATNVRFVWSPNVSYPGSTPLADLYPGNEAVDWVGLDGYNGGTALDWGGWVSFEQLFAPSLAELGELAPDKPVVIAETASAEQGGDKAAWIHGFFDGLEARPDIRAFVWFNHDKETDWRIESSPQSRTAFATRVDHERYE